MIAFESTIERDYLYLADYDPTVTILEEQPLTIPYTHEGKLYHYTPDFRVRQSERERLIECKPAARVDEGDNQRKFAAARAWCAEHRWEFQVVTETEIRRGSRLKNVKCLTYYARFTVKPQLRRRIHDLLKNSPTPVSFAALATALEPEPLDQAKAAILHLAFFHKIAMPIDTEFIMDTTVVNLPGKE
jgi:hypothetical protein